MTESLTAGYNVHESAARLLLMQTNAKSWYRAKCADDDLTVGITRSNHSLGCGVIIDDYDLES